MPRFDIFSNPNNAAAHALFVDVQSDFVRLKTRWCIPLIRRVPSLKIMPRVHALAEVNHQEYVLDTPNLLAVPVVLLRKPIGRLSAYDQHAAESCIEYILRGY
jgi:hypothetical protein